MKKKSIRVGTEHHQATKEVPRERGRIVLAHGEVTGHAHAIASKSAALHETTDNAAAIALGTRILSARAAVALRHEEHSPINIPRGEWGVRIQRQYEAGEFRRVED
jgi:hypothetical protein